MCLYFLLAGNVDPWNSTFVWLIDTVPPTACNAVPRLPCSEGGVTSSTLCTVDVHGDGVVSALYQLNESSDWKATNDTSAELLVTKDGVHTVHLKVCPL